MICYRDLWGLQSQLLCHGGAERQESGHKAQKATQQAYSFRDQSLHPSYLNINISCSIIAGAPTTQKTGSPGPQSEYVWVCSSHKNVGKGKFYCLCCICPITKKECWPGTAQRCCCSQLDSPAQILRPLERAERPLLKQ